MSRSRCQSAGVRLFGRRSQLIAVSDRRDGWVRTEALTRTIQSEPSWKRANQRCAGKPNGMVHDLRRSRAKIWGKAGVSETVAMFLGGWRTTEVWRRYDESDLIRAQERTEKYLLEEAEEQGVTKISTAVN